jgi:hypothetical protein
MAGKPEEIDVKKEIRKREAYNQHPTTDGLFWQDRGKMYDAASSFVDPFSLSDNAFGKLRTVSRSQYGGVSCRVLRAIAQKAWVINTCINHIQKKTRPFFKPATDRNSRGFVIEKMDVDMSRKKSARDKKAEEIRDFLMNTGNYEDADRDDFVKFCNKLLRDLLTLDQIATELQYNKMNQLCAFFAVDAGTIERVMPLTEAEKADNVNPENYKYLQIIEGAPAAAYTSESMLFDFENPRTDIYHSMYGYSYVEQAVDLITSVIHAFSYNMGNFTENKAPKGMLLVNGDADEDEIDTMTDYIAQIMSGGPANQWRIPVIPSGGKDNTIEWKEINGKNREMEFQAWLDYLTSGVVAMFGCSMDELGLQSQKSQAMFENGGKDRISASKSLILGDILSFLESYINKIVKKIDPEYRFEFVGYELTDPKAEADFIKTKVESVQTLNEARLAMGLDKLDAEWADIPLNPQAVQLYQASKSQDDAGGGDENGGEEDWGDYQGNDGENGEGEPGVEDNPEGGDVPEESGKNLKKSLYVI